MTAPSQTASCPYCLSALDTPTTATCPGCSAKHHSDCWTANGGCAVFGCGAGPTSAPGHAAASASVGDTDSTAPPSPGVPVNGASPAPPYAPTPWYPPASATASPTHTPAFASQQLGPGHVAQWPTAGSRQPTTTRTNGLAIAALVIGVVGLLLLPILAGPIGVPLAAVGLSRSREYGSGRGMSIAGLVLGIFNVLIGLAALAAL